MRIKLPSCDFYANGCIVKSSEVASDIVTGAIVVVSVEWRSQSLLRKSQCNDSALHLSCRDASDGLQHHYFLLCLSQSPGCHFSAGGERHDSRLLSLHVHRKVDERSICQRINYNINQMLCFAVFNNGGTYSTLINPRDT